MQIQQIDELIAFSSEKLKKHNLFQTERFFLDVYCLRPGQAQAPHAHTASDKVYIVLDGVCSFLIDGETADLGEGSAVLAPAGSDHGVSNPGPGDARILVMMTPPPSARP